MPIGWTECPNGSIDVIGRWRVLPWTLGRGSRGVRYSTGIGEGEREVDLDALETFQPTLFLYDNYPGGIGFSSALFDLSVELLHSTRQLIAECRCEEGCPSCVGPVGEVSPQGRSVALE